MSIKGYKVFDNDWTCLGYQYQVGRTEELKGELIKNKNGFHFCTNLSDCFCYYSFDWGNKVAEIEAVGDILINEKSGIGCTNKIKVVREISWYEVLTLVNEGEGNTGKNNFGCNNSGNENCNHTNTGNKNIGCGNVGSYNCGNTNTGFFNVGYCNSGSMNIGSFNSGKGNQASFCVGDFNIVNYSNGYLCTEEQPFLIFDKPSPISVEEWVTSRAYRLLEKLCGRPTKWVLDYTMTEEEKQQHPESKITGGYLKTITLKESAIEMWDKFTKDEKNEIINNTPNFDADKFYKIFGINVKANFWLDL